MVELVNFYSLKIVLNLIVKIMVEQTGNSQIQQRNKLLHYEQKHQSSNSLGNIRKFHSSGLNSAKNSQSNQQNLIKLTPVQTPPSKFTGGSASQKTLTEEVDGDEIYDSVRSLSQAIDDDSLNFKKARAMQVQAQASLELHHDEIDLENEDESGQQQSRSIDEGESEESEEAYDDKKMDHMSALQQMLLKSELFIQKQASSPLLKEKPQTDLNSHKEDDPYFSSAKQSANQHHYPPQTQSSQDSVLPGVQAQETSGEDEQNSGSIKYEHSSPSTARKAQNQYLVEDIEANVDDDMDSLNVRNEAIHSPLQHMRNGSSKVQSQKEIETVDMDRLIESNNNISELTVQRNPSFLTVVKTSQVSPNDKRSSIHQIQEQMFRTPHDSLNDASQFAIVGVSTQPNHNLITLNSINKSINSEYASLQNSPSQYETPVVGGENTLQSLVVQQDEERSVVQQPQLEVYSSQSTENYGSVRVYKHDTDALCGMQAPAGSVFAAAIVTNETDTGNEEPISSAHMPSSQTRTLRQSIDQSSPENRKNTEEMEQEIFEKEDQHDSIDYRTGPRCVGSSASNSRDSIVEPLQTSGAASHGAFEASNRAAHGGLDAEEYMNQNKMTTQIQPNNYMDSFFDQAPQLTPVQSGEEIKVLHFARSRDQIDSLQSDELEDANNGDADCYNFQQQVVNSHSESKPVTQSFIGQVASYQQVFPQSLTNSLKKSVQLHNSDKLGQQSASARSFTDVLNAMRDTEVIENEKRQLENFSPEASHAQNHFQLTDRTLKQSVEEAKDETRQLIVSNARHDEQLLQTRESRNTKQAIMPHEEQFATIEDRIANTTPARNNLPSQEAATGVGFVTDEDAKSSPAPPRKFSTFDQVAMRTEASQSNDIQEITGNMSSSQQFQAIYRQHLGQTRGSLMEVYSDSLNATTSKSEEKKCNSVNEEEHRTSPSFYINDISDNENEGEVQEDAKDTQHNNYVPASSFASGAQAQIAYTDKLGQNQAYQEGQSSHPGGTGTNKNQAAQASSHYRGESFGNCLPLQSVATSSHRDSNSQVQGVEINGPIEIDPAFYQPDQIESKIYEQCPDDEESQKAVGNNYENSLGGEILLIEDNIEQTNQESSIKADTVEQAANREEKSYEQEEDQQDDEENRKMTKSLSKTDSLRDLKQFFSREQRNADQQLDSPSNDPVSFQSERLVRTKQLAGDQLQQQTMNNKFYAEVIAEENLEESSPEKLPKRMSQQLSNKTSSGRRDHPNNSHEQSPRARGIKAYAGQREGRESQKDVLCKLPPVEVSNANKRISLPTSTNFVKVRTPENERLSFSIVEAESDAFAGNGPPQSINQSEYSMIKNLVEKISTTKSPNDDIDQSNKQSFQDTISRLQQELIQTQNENTELTIQKNKAQARVEMLEAQSQIAGEQLQAEQKNAYQCQEKYRRLRDEFKKMKRKYESELANCVKEMENLRVIMIDVVSQQSEQKANNQVKPRATKKKVRAQYQAAPIVSQPAAIHFVQSSTGEPTLIPEMTEHAQSEKAYDGTTPNSSVHRQIGLNGPNRGDSTSSDSPVRKPLIRPQVKQRSGRFSSHEQFSMNSSQAQTARFSGDFTKGNKGVMVLSEYGDDNRNNVINIGQRNKYHVDKRDDSNSSSSLLSRTTTTKKFTLKITDLDSKHSKSSKNETSTSKIESTRSKIRFRAAALETTGAITENTEEDYTSVFESNRRTIDLVKSTMKSGGSVFQQQKRETKIKNTQNLQNMLANLYQQSRKSAISQQPPTQRKQDGIVRKSSATLKSARKSTTKTILMKKK